MILIGLQDTEWQWNLVDSWFTLHKHLHFLAGKAPLVVILGFQTHQRTIFGIIATIPGWIIISSWFWLKRLATLHHKHLATWQTAQSEPMEVMRIDEAWKGILVIGHRISPSTWTTSCSPSISSPPSPVSRRPALAVTNTIISLVFLLLSLKFFALNGGTSSLFLLNLCLISFLCLKLHS